jgi:hypothetical protein
VKAFLKAFHHDADVKELPRCQYDVLRALCFLAGQSKGDCFPHHKTVAQVSRYSTRSVIWAIRKLVKDEYLHVQREYLVTKKGKKLIVRNRYFFRKWARLENGIWSNGAQKWEDGVTEAPIKRGVVRRAASEADPQEGGHAIFAPGVMQKLHEGSCSLDPLNKGTLNKGNSYPGEKDKNLSLSEENGDGAGAPGEREKSPVRTPLDNFSEQEVTKEKEFQTFVTQSKDTPGGLQRVQPAARRGFKTNAATPCCTCDSEHPAGMPSLQEMISYRRKLQVPSDEHDPESVEIWLTEEIEELHDTWLVNGFRTKNGSPIQDWKASLRNWKRWRKGGGSDVF